MIYGSVNLIDYRRPQTSREWDKNITPPLRKVWEIECKPHISLQLKRMFPVLSSQQGKLRLADTPQSCRDLAWFMLRYPMKVDPAHKLYSASEAHKAR